MIDKDITLSRDIDIQCFDCFADIATNVERKDILAMLELAREEGNRLKAKSIVYKLLPGSPLVMGENLVRRYMIMGFIDEKGFLTEVANYALETGRTLIPECGQYRIWATDDPLVPQKILKIQRQELRDSRLESQRSSFAEHSNNNNNNKKSWNTSKTLELPKWLLGIGELPIPIWDSGDIDTVSVKKIEKRGFQVKVGVTHTKLKAKLTLGNNKSPLLNLVTKDKESTFGRPNPPFVNFDKVWKKVLKDNNVIWTGGPLDQGYTKLAVNDLSEKERLGFLKGFIFRDIAFETLGPFEDIEITLKVQPSTQKDAERWALLNLMDRIGTYVTDKMYHDIVESVKGDFLSFSPKKLPERGTFARDIQNEALFKGNDLPPIFWHLQAIEDLSFAGGEA